MQLLSNSNILLHFSLNEEVWIGVHTLSTSSPYVYQYVDGKMADFFDWNNDEPNKQDTDFCIRLYKSNLLYGTWDCGNKAQYLCEGTLSLSLSLSLSLFLSLSLSLSLTSSHHCAGIE